jgi:hypothetical protein
VPGQDPGAAAYNCGSERLSCVSSGLPWPAVAKNGVENREELPHGGGQRDLSGMARGAAPMVGRMASANWAMTRASSVSVLAGRPVARAKSRIWRGLTTATGRPALARVAATVAS